MEKGLKIGVAAALLATLGVYAYNVFQFYAGSGCAAEISGTCRLLAESFGAALMKQLPIIPQTTFIPLAVPVGVGLYFEKTNRLDKNLVLFVVIAVGYLAVFGAVYAYSQILFR